ncbi:MAG: methylmalonyl-CoA mutase family protein [Alphaproteobacteria bacterium]
MTRDVPWIFRTYAGHSTAKASNALTRENLSRGQTGLSIAFDLPTQTGYDADHALCRGEVGKVGVPVAHLGDMRALFEGIPLGAMNTSMTINATAPWLLALYIALADESGVPRASLQGDPRRHHSRSIFRAAPTSSPEIVDAADYGHGGVQLARVSEVESGECLLYHLQEAGATPVEELSFALATAIAVLDRARKSVPAADLAQVVGRISFFVNAGLRFVEEMCKMRAFAELWDEIARSLWCCRREAPAPPLRRPGELAGADRAAAGKQCLPHSPGDARRHAVEEGAHGRCSCRLGTRRSACRGRGTGNGPCARNRILAYEVGYLLEYEDLFEVRLLSPRKWRS